MPSEILIGLMSGTSGDVVDAVALRFADPGESQGSTRPKFLAHHHADFDTDLRTRVLAASGASAVELARLDVDMGLAFAAAALAAMRLASLAPGEVAAVVTAGLTVVHVPPADGRLGATLTVGDADLIAERTGCLVVGDVRARDRAAGGHGAPLVPFADAILLRQPERVVAALNLGGIGNLTVVPPVGDPVAFDTGPGNMLLDGALARVSDGRLAMDEDGRLGQAGTVDAAWLEQLLGDDDFLSRPPPKSTGRERYGPSMLDRHAERIASLSREDLAATLAAYTVESVASALETWIDVQPAELIVSGGGAANACLMAGLSRRLAPIVVTDSQSALGIPILAKEAVAMAIIGHATLHDRPSNVPGVTGASRPCVLGKLSLPPMGSGRVRALSDRD